MLVSVTWSAGSSFEAGTCTAGPACDTVVVVSFASLEGGMASEGSRRLEEALKLMAEAIQVAQSKLKLAEMEPSFGVASPSALAEGIDTPGEGSVGAQVETAPVAALTKEQWHENVSKNLYPRWRTDPNYFGPTHQLISQVENRLFGSVEGLTGDLRSMSSDEYWKKRYDENGGGTGLHWAVRMEDLDLVTRILDANQVDVNAKDEVWKATSLHWAVQIGNMAIVKAMCSHPFALEKFDLSVEDKWGFTAQEFAILKSNVPMVEVLLQLGNAHLNRASVIQEVSDVVCKGGSMEVLQHYFDSQRETWYTKISRDHKGTSLHWAVRMEDTTVASQIISKGKVDVNAKDNYGFTPLHLAIWAGNLDMVKVMVAKHLELGNFDVNFVEKGTRYTALHCAILNGKVESIDIVRELLKCKETMRLTEECESGESPLQIAHERGHKDIQKSLLECEGVQRYMDELYRDRQVYVDAANAILVGAALIASVTFASWLQPPLGYGTLGYVDLQHDRRLRAFWIFNCLSFYFAIGTVVFGARSVLPRSPYFIKVTVEKLRNNLLVTAFLLAWSVFFVIIAFGIAGCLVLSPTFSMFQLYMVIPTIIGGLVCVVSLGFLSRSMWQDSSLGKSTTLVKVDEWMNKAIERSTITKL